MGTQAQDWQFTVHDSQFHGSLLTVPGSRFTIHCSMLAIPSSRFTTRSEREGREGGRERETETETEKDRQAQGM